MCSYKIRKIKSSIPLYFKREEPGNSYKQIKEKWSFSGVNISVSNLSGSPGIFEASKGLGGTTSQAQQFPFLASRCAKPQLPLIVQPKPVPSGRCLLTMAKFGFQQGMQPCPTLDHSSCVLTLRKYFPESSLSNPSHFFTTADFSAPASQDPLLQ